MLHCFVHGNLGQRSEKCTLQIQCWFWSKERGYKTRSQTTAFCSHEKSYSHFLKTCVQGFQMPITLTSNFNNLSTSVHSKLSQHLKVRNIAQHSREGTWTKMEMTSFAPEQLFFFGGGGVIGVPRHTQEKSISLHHLNKTSFC